MTNSSTSETQSSLDQVYNRLRRISYDEAVIEYFVACTQIKGEPGPGNLREIVNPIIEKFGWSVDDLYDEAMRLELIRLSNKHKRQE